VCVARGQRLTALRHERLEILDVELAGLDPQLVAPSVEPDPPVTEDPAQMVHVHPQAGRCATRRRDPPQRLLQGVGRQRPAAVTGEHRKECSQMAPRQLDRHAIVGEYVQRAEQPDPHPVLPCPIETLTFRRTPV
jgi:hypothetical protein